MASRQAGGRDDDMTANGAQTSDQTVSRTPVAPRLHVLLR